MKTNYQLFHTIFCLVKFLVSSNGTIYYIFELNILCKKLLFHEYLKLKFLFLNQYLSKKTLLLKIKSSVEVGASTSS